MNLESLTREDYTNAFLQQTIPDNASTDWEKQATNLKDLLSKLAFHPAMGTAFSTTTQPTTDQDIVDSGNMAQTYMTPAHSKNKIYFMWDFVGRTFTYLNKVPPASNFSARSEAWSDVISRSEMAADLLLDTDPGMLDMTIESTYPGQPSDRPEIGEDVKAAARKLKAR